MGKPAASVSGHCKKHGTHPGRLVCPKCFPHIYRKKEARRG